jgi:hypothetical protein
MNDLVSNPFAAPAAKPQNGALAQAGEQRVIAEVQAMLVIAKKFPRDERAAVDKILNAFTRPSLCEVAKYQYSRGGSDVDGPSIRSAEAIAQLWGNIEFGFREIGRGVGPDGAGFSEVEAYAWDMQSMTRRPAHFRVRHWRDTKKGGYPITDERDIYELVANQAQRRVRACILAIIPGDVIEAAMSQAEATLRTKADTSPEAMVKMLEAFAAFAVTKEQIEKRIQRRLDAIQPAQVVSLKKIYASLRDGMSTPAEWFETEEAPAATPPAVKTADKALDAFSGSKPTPTPKPTPKPAKEPAKEPAIDPATGEFLAVPEIPEEAILAWVDEQKWMPAWKWIGMNLTAMPQEVRGAFVADNLQIIQAVAAHNEKYAKAVRELMAQAGVAYGD